MLNAPQSTAAQVIPVHDRMGKIKNELDEMTQSLMALEERLNHVSRREPPEKAEEKNNVPMSSALVNQLDENYLTIKNQVLWVKRLLRELEV